MTVYACGPWLPKLFPEMLGERIFPTRQEVFFFAPPAGRPAVRPAQPCPSGSTGPTRAAPTASPTWRVAASSWPSTATAAPFDPDTGDRRLSDEGLAEARRFLAERFPDLRDAPLTESRVCQYENTSNGDFLIDRHPEHENVWLVGGGSGHGYKHGPAVGEYVAGRILRDRAAEPRFTLANKTAVQRRTVW